MRNRTVLPQQPCHLADGGRLDTAQDCGSFERHGTAPSREQLEGGAARDRPVTVGEGETARQCQASGRMLIGVRCRVVAHRSAARFIPGNKTSPRAGGERFGAQQRTVIVTDEIRPIGPVAHKDGVEPALFDHDARHCQCQGGIRAGPDRQPAIRLDRKANAARIGPPAILRDAEATASHYHH
jgi:hypothetical protein